MNNGKQMLIARKAPDLTGDCEIAARIKEGDREALRQFVERHIGRLQNYLFHRLGQGNEEVITKVVESTFHEALRRIDTYASGNATTPMDLWLIRLAEKDLAKARPRSTTAGTKGQGTPTTTTQPSVAGSQAEDDSPAPLSDLDRFRAAMDVIPNRCRTVLSMAVFEQMPADEIAQCLNVSPAGAMKKLRDALKRLNKALDEQGIH